MAGKGRELVDRPLAATADQEARLTEALGWMSTLFGVSQRTRDWVQGMASFLTSKAAGIAADLRQRINSELGRAAAGLIAPNEATTAIEGLLETSRSRANTIVRTELGRVFSTAAQATMEQAVGAGVAGLQKQWRRSGKLHSRPDHDLADGQVVAVDQPFVVGGEELMFPRDPNGSAGNTINCGCAQLPWMASWTMSHPGAVPITAAEQAADPGKRLVEEVRQADRSRGS
jgi:uncharacterized protein with gpF-like domain